MTMREIRPIMTAARRAHLTRLLDGEASPHGSGNVAWYCRMLGWSSFVIVAPDGRRITLEQAKEECPGGLFMSGYSFSDPTMEVITDAGRAALARLREARRK